METAQFQPGDQVRVKPGEMIEGTDVSGKVGTIVAGPREHPFAGDVYIVDLGESVCSEERAEELRAQADKHVEQMRASGSEPADWRFDDLPTAPNRILLSRTELQSADETEVTEQTFQIGDRVKLGEFPKLEVWDREITGTTGTVRGTYVFHELENVEVGPPGQKQEVGSGYTVHAIELDEPFMSAEHATKGLDYLDVAELMSGIPSPRTCFPDLELHNGRFQFAPPEVLEPEETE